MTLVRFFNDTLLDTFLEVSLWEAMLKVLFNAFLTRFFGSVLLVVLVTFFVNASTKISVKLLLFFMSIVEAFTEIAVTLVVFELFYF